MLPNVENGKFKKTLYGIHIKDDWYKLTPTAYPAYLERLKRMGTPILLLF